MRETMASLNLSTNGPSITKSYQSIVNSPPPSGSAAASPTYGQWSVFSVSAPLANAFQQDAGSKQSVLKVQSVGDGELVDLIDEFSDGRIQFAFVKVKDPNTALPKYVLIGWCGEGVPERTKGYFTSHLATVGKTLHGYHVQITARSDRDLSPESIVQKVSEASGSKYSGDVGGPSASGGPPPPQASKPAFTPTRIGSSGPGGFNPLAGTQSQARGSRDANVDKDGWGEDAPPVSRSQLEKVQSAYQPTKVDMAQLTKQPREPSRFEATRNAPSQDQEDVVKGGYQPVGKVDIAALRQQARQTGPSNDDRPAAVKGSYEPVGKVDIAAIRARAQPKREDEHASPPPDHRGQTPSHEVEPTVSHSERLTSLPKPKIGNKFGSSSGSFTGTKAPTPGGFGTEQRPPPPAPPMGSASRTFADQGGKTPAQVWAEKKARERGLSGASDIPPSAGLGGPASPVANQKSGGEWSSGYTGKSWAPVQTTSTGKSAGSGISQQHTGPDEPHQGEAPSPQGGGVGALRDRFKGAVPMGAPKSPTGEQRPPSPPPLDTSSKPSTSGIPIPGLPSRPKDQAGGSGGYGASGIPSPPRIQRSPTPPTPPDMRSGSPIQVAMPVGRGPEPISAPEERYSPDPVPAHSLALAADAADEQPEGDDLARGAAEATAASTFGAHAAETTDPGAGSDGKRALIQYDYEKAEDNEIELREGEYVENIEMVDKDWWMGQNAQGEMGLFPSNYVELVDDDIADEGPPPPPAAVEAAPPAGPAAGNEAAPTAIAQYDYEAAEENELSFAEGAKITGLEFPDDDWWFGQCNGQSGLFPANYVQLEE
ncbi:MAG: hypothetical protein M1833_001705 [Piccolia ochrophora]|nr:MAG: hypothetical protein M1833_001705 [Piccolia ochrophora]